MFYFILKGGPGQSFEERLPDFPDVEADQVHPPWLQHKRRRLYDVLGKNIEYAEVFESDAYHSDRRRIQAAELGMMQRQCIERQRFRSCTVTGRIRVDEKIQDESIMWFGDDA